MQTVLVIEDEEDIVDLIRYHLEQANYRVITAHDGENGLYLARKELPSLIVLDLMLPKIDGKDVCRALKSDKNTRNIPILMLTARAEEMDRVIGFELGADDYVTKPFSPRELVLRVKAIIQRTNPSKTGENRIKICDLMIDIPAHKVYVSEKPVLLTHTEFKLLLELARHRGHVMTREQLLNRVWGYTYEGYARTVDTHVRRLRKKLDMMADLIETVHGVG